MDKQTNEHLLEQTPKQMLPVDPPKSEAKRKQNASSPSSRPTNPVNSPSIPTTSTSTRDAQTVDGSDLVECRTCGQPRRADSYCVRTPACEAAAWQHAQSMQRLIANPSIHVEPRQASENAGYCPQCRQTIGCNCPTTTGHQTTGHAAGHARTASSSLRKFQVEVRQADGSYVEAGHVSYFPVTPFNSDDVFELTRLDRVRMLPSRFGYWLRPYDMLLDRRRWRWVKSGARRQAEWLTPERLEAIAAAVEAKLRDHDA